MDVTTNETKAALAIPPGLHWSEIDLYVVYLALTNPKPRVFEDLLLEHTLFRTNLDVYRRTTKFANELRNKIGLELSRTTSARLARTWYVWAEEMSENKRPVEFLGHNIVDLLGHVVRARLAERCTELGTGTDRIGNRVSSFPGASLDHVYRLLASHHRRAVEDLLLGHVFLSHGVDAYGGGKGRCNSFYRESSYERLELYVGRQAATAWKKWSAAVAQKSLAPDECRNEVFMILKSLIAVKLAETQLLTDVPNGDVLKQSILVDGHGLQLALPMVR